MPFHGPLSGNGAPILSLLVLAAALAGGTAATYTYDRRSGLGWRLPEGLCLGLAALGLVGFPIAMRFGLTTWGIAIAAAVTAAPVALLGSRAHRQAIATDLATSVDELRSAVSRAGPKAALFSTAYAAGVLLLWRVAARVMFTAPDGIHTGSSHNLGDLPFHLTIIARFVSGENYPPQHPSFAGVGFTYPFLTDFVAAMFVHAGAPVRAAIVWSTFTLCLAFAALLYRWTLDLTGNRAAALLAPPLALCSGGLGWWLFATEVWQSGSGAFTLVTNLSHDYTITYDGVFRWGNMVTTLLVTQRGLLLGLPLALVVFRLWWTAGDEGTDDSRQARMIAAGVIAGMLPLVHAHSYAVILGMAGCLALLSRERWSWLLFFLWALAVGLPQIWWISRASGVRGGTFLAWAVGWDRGQQNAVLFWLRNTGAFIPLVIAALAWRGERPLLSRRLLLFYLPFTLCFIVPNVLRLAPWIWDNIKVLVFWYLASVPLVALVLARLSQSGAGSVLAAVLFISMTLAGALDLWRAASGGFDSLLFDRDATGFAATVSERTPPSSLILHAPIPNHPIGLSGRQSLMGYGGHVWSHGLDPGPREADIKRMYAGGPEAAGLFVRYGIDYVAVGPIERSQMGANEQFFEQYERAVELPEYRLYRIPRDGK